MRSSVTSATRCAVMGVEGARHGLAFISMSHVRKSSVIMKSAPYISKQFCTHTRAHLIFQYSLNDMI